MPDAIENSDEELAPKKSSGKIFVQEVEEGLDALHLPFHRLLISAIAAGLELALSLFVISLIRTIGTGSLSAPVLELLAAAGLSFGFIVVVLGRSELFTEQTTLAILPLLAGKSSPLEVARLWGIVFVGNLIGATVSAYLIVVLGPAMHNVDVNVFHHIATTIVDHPAWVILLSGVVAGWLMGLVSWLVAASRDTISQIFIIGLFTGVIGLGHLHHSILGAAEVLGGVFSRTGTTFGDFGHFLLWATIGNAIGGAGFVALLKFGHARAEDSA
ncbi:MAG TPA: formate/nitrite transporter family protein [Lacipirellulaceae bacterium]|jgi:formate/nitrite transporter FocA (FNT family)|nr:formate/nitrite transporter family protein [Lacipirellulaceae bacterium]